MGAGITVRDSGRGCTGKELGGLGKWSYGM